MVECSTGISSKQTAALYIFARNLGATHYKSDDFMKPQLLLPVAN